VKLETRILAEFIGGVTALIPQVGALPGLSFPPKFSAHISPRLFPPFDADVTCCARPKLLAEFRVLLDTYACLADVISHMLLLLLLRYIAGVKFEQMVEAAMGDSQAHISLTCRQSQSRTAAAVAAGCWHIDDYDGHV
jgi:hypothetical protein